MEAQLIERLLNKEIGAFEELVRTYEEIVVKTCFGFVQSAEDAEDIAQDVFVEVFISIKQFRKDAKLSTWLYRIAVNKSLDFLRKQKRQKRWNHLKKVVGIPLDEMVNDKAENPEQTYFQNEKRQQLNSAISKLPENQKIAFTLAKVDEISHKEVATIMDLSVSAVEALLHRAKKNLRKHLQQFYNSLKK